jgi:sigma-E factor negative regulatory protein RseC
MIQEEAIIIARHKKDAEVQIIRSRPCGLCGQTQGCGNGIWGKIFSRKNKNILLDNKINAEVGDKVILSIEEYYLLKTSLLLYGIPLLSMFFGMVFLSFLAESEKDLISFFGGVIGFIIIVKFISTQQHDRLFKEAVMSKVI